jgi:hypothetical protein
VGAGLHPAKFAGVDQAAGLVRVGNVQRDDIGLRQKLVLAVERHGVAERKLADDVVVHDPHAEAFGEDAELGADVAVADDAEGLAADFETALGGLQPLAAVCRRVLGRDAAHQHHDFGQHEFSHRASVSIRRVEYRHAAVPGGSQVDLVGPDAVAADGRESFGAFEDAFRDPAARADAEEVHVRNPLGQLVGGQCSRDGFDLVIAGSR